MIAWLLASALASPDAVQVKALPGAVEFAEQYVAAIDPSFQYADLGVDNYSCYDRLGVQNFNLAVPIDTVDMALGPDRLTVTVDFGTIEGTNMVLYGSDADTFDACPQFAAFLYYARIYNGRVVADLELDTGFGGFFDSPVLTFDWASPPIVEGDIDTDVDYVPDALVLYFLEDTIRQAAADALTDALPPMIAEFLGETSYAGDYGGLATSFDLTDAEIASDALSMYVDVELGASSLTPCEIGNPGNGPVPTGLRSPRLALNDPAGADLGVGITERLIGEALHASWEAGWFCFESDTVGQLVQGLSLWIDPDVASLEGWATLDTPPEIVVTESGIDVTVRDIRMEITGRVNGKTVPIIVTTLDLTGTAVPGFEQSLTSMTLSLVDPTFDFTSMELRHVPAGNLAQPLIEKEVEAWAADWARDSMQNVVLFDALYYAYDVAMLLDRTETREGGLEMYFELYDLDDPAVDTIAPEASVEVVSQQKRSVTLLASATDDRTEPLAFSWQVNGAGWSSWTTEPELKLSSLADGEYTIEVTARDVWLNVDETPATVLVTIDGPAKKDDAVGCGCTTGGSGGLAWLALAAIAIRRRGGAFRRRGGRVPTSR